MGRVSQRPDFEPPADPQARQPQSAVHLHSSPFEDPGGKPPRSKARIVARAVLIGAAVGALLLIGVIVAFLRNSGDPNGLPIPNPFKPSPTRTLKYPLPTAGPRPNEPLLQEVWRKTDPIYPMDLDGFTFSFRAPEEWGCMRSSKGGVRWVCVDQTGIFGGKKKPDDPSGGIIQSDECKAPCGPKEYADVLARLNALSIDTDGLSVVDDRTKVDDRVSSRTPGQREYRVSRTYDSNGDGKLDRHLWVRLDVSKADQVIAKKMLGDLYDATR